MLVIDKYKVAYLHINKTAGTSIKDYLKVLVGSENTRQMGPVHSPLYANMRFMGDRFYEYKVLVSLRSPFARLLSIYLFRKSKFEAGQDIPAYRITYEMPFKEWAKETIFNSNRLTDLSISDSILIGGKLPENVYTIAVESLEKDLPGFCENVLNIKTFNKIPHDNRTDIIKDIHRKYFDDELMQMVYKWDKWVIDNYYPWSILGV